ncbi:unnamed protein product, partial [Ectocarpus sp. 12 AP-2014]
LLPKPLLHCCCCCCYRCAFTRVYLLTTRLFPATSSHTRCGEAPRPIGRAAAAALLTGQQKRERVRRGEGSGCRPSAQCCLIPPSCLCLFLSPSRTRSCFTLPLPLSSLTTSRHDSEETPAKNASGRRTAHATAIGSR